MNTHIIIYQDVSLPFIYSQK